MAKYMLIMRSDDDALEKFQGIGFDEILDGIGRFNDELVRAGVLLAAEGLDDAGQGVVVDFTGEEPVVTDGPYGETKELFGGTTSSTCLRRTTPSPGPGGCRSPTARRSRSAA
ncbi:hypothetical protein GCM10025864_32000 [Luteimicrobium album]|uniref:YCII-related domain-containing protein n=1 Tax=Luteimicrobium album TaxID=1054550 RepID=A0ABQ6I5A2_9MICO|nr:hypothetical protein GCM10025864_32000 [Luteimicrobium album]